MQKINKILQFVTCVACACPKLDATESDISSQLNNGFVEDTKLNLTDVSIEHARIADDNNSTILNHTNIDYPPKDINISPSKIFFRPSSIVDFDRYTSSNTRNSTEKKISDVEFEQDINKIEIEKLSMQDASILKKNDIENISEYIDEYCQPLGSAKKCLCSKFKVSISNYQYKTSEGMIYSCIEKYNDQKGQLVAWIFTTKNQSDKVTSCTKCFNDFHYKKVLRLRTHDKKLQSLHDVFKKNDVKEMIPYLSQAGFTIIRNSNSYYATLDKYEHNLNNDKAFPLRGSRAESTKTVSNSNQNLNVPKASNKKSTSIEKIQQRVQPMALNEQQILRIKQYLFNYGQPACGYSKTIGLNHQNHALLEIWKYFNNDISAIATPLRKAGFVIITQIKNQSYCITLPEYKENPQGTRWNRLEDTISQNRKIKKIYSHIAKYGEHIRGFSKAVRLQDHPDTAKLLTEFAPDYLTNTATLKKAGFEIVKCINATYITSLRYTVINLKKTKIEEKLENLNK